MPCANIAKNPNRLRFIKCHMGPVLTSVIADRAKISTSNQKLFVDKRFSKVYQIVNLTSLLFSHLPCVL